MRERPRAVVLAGLVGLTMAACASTGPASGTPAPAAPATSPISTASTTSAAPPVTATVSGTVAYRERIALPPDATLEVWMRDTSPGIDTMAILAETTTATQGRQVPLPFELQVDPSRVEHRRSYGLKAAIRASGQLLFANDAAVPVLTHGHPSLVVLTLTRVPQEAALADAPPLWP